MDPMPAADPVPLAPPPFGFTVAEETEQRHAATAVPLKSQRAHLAAVLPPAVLKIHGRHKGRRAVCMGVYSLHGDADALSPVYRRDEPPHSFLFRGEGNVWCVASGQHGIGALRSDRAAAAIEDVLAGGAVQWEFRNAIGRGFTVDPNISVLVVKLSTAVAAAEKEGHERKAAAAADLCSDPSAAR